MPPTQQEYDELLKLTAALIRKSGGIITFDAADLYDQQPPIGFLKRWDNSKRQLIVELVEHGTTIFVGKETEQWQSLATPGGIASREPLSTTPTVPLPPQPSPHQPDQVVIPFRPQPLVDQRAGRQPRVVGDEEAVSLERQRSLAAALSMIEDNQPSRSTESPRFNSSRIHVPLAPPSVMSSNEPRPQTLEDLATYFKR